MPELVGDDRNVPEALAREAHPDQVGHRVDILALRRHRHRRAGQVGCPLEFLDEPVRDAAPPCVEIGAQRDCAAKESEALGEEACAVPLHVLERTPRVRCRSGARDPVSQLRHLEHQQRLKLFVQTVIEVRSGLSTAST